jgi:hypothetical protein
VHHGGWTADEILAWEQFRLQLMPKPIIMAMPEDESWFREECEKTPGSIVFVKPVPRNKNYERKAGAALRPRGRAIGRAPACGVPNDAFCPTARKRANSKKTTRGECCGCSAFPQRDDRLPDGNRSRAHELRYQMTSVVGSNAENICSQ